MPRFAANLSMMFTEVPFLDRFDAAAKPALAAASKRSRNGTSENIIERLAAKRGIVCPLVHFSPGSFVPVMRA